MKILWLTEFYPGNDKNSIIGGVQARNYYVGRHLAKTNSLQVIEGVETKWAKPSFQSFLIRLIHLPLEIVKGLVTDFDLIEASNFVMYFPSLIIAKIKNKPLIFWYPDVFLGSWVENVGSIGIIGEIVEKTLLRIGADHYIAISESVKSKLIAAGVNPEKVSVIYCGVDFGQIDACEKRRNKVNYDIVSVSRLTSYKRIDDLIRAAEILKRKNNKIRIVVLGKGSELTRLKNLVKQLNLELNILFINSIASHEDVLDLISSARVFCHPSVVEGFGIANVEAMALGRPVVAAKISVIEEITQGGKGSLLFDPKNAEDLAKNLDMLLSSGKLYNQKRKEALALAKKYDWEGLAGQTEKVYGKVLNA